MAGKEEINELHRELVALSTWDKMLSYCLSGATPELYGEEVESYKARALRRREIVRKMDNFITRAERLRASSSK